MKKLLSLALVLASSRAFALDASITKSKKPVYHDGSVDTSGITYRLPSLHHRHNEVQKHSPEYEALS